MSSLVDREVVARAASPAPAGFGVSEFFRYHGLWAPGVRLFRHIGFRSKALVISAVFLLPIAFLGLSYFKTQGGNIAFSAKERDGLAYGEGVLGLLDLLQQRRLHAVAGGGGGGSANPPEADIRAREKALEALQQRLGESLGTASAWSQWRAKADALAAAPAAMEAHDAHSQALIDLLGVSTDGSNLTLDPDIDTYYLMDTTMFRLPAMVEAIGRLRVVGGQALASGTVSPAQLRLLVEQASGVSNNLAAVRAGLDKAMAYNADVRAALGDTVAMSAVADYLAQIDRTLLAPGGASGDARAHADGGQKAVDALVALNGRAAAELDRLIAVRVQGMEAARNVTVAVLVLSLLLAAYLFISFRKVLEGGLREVEFHINAMRDGDLTTRPRAWGGDEAARLMHTLASMQSALRRIVSQVRGASDSIVSASTQITSGANDLSSRTERSAANLEETASAMEQIAATVKRGEDTVSEASQLAVANAEQAEQGGRIVSELAQTMQAISGSSVRIGDIIGTIDGIAFQTNILALNAAVEAARAGEQGRGFAVVASEVRALAQRSAVAAREIKSLVNTSLSQTEAGVQVVQKAGDQIHAIVGSARRVNQLLAEVSVGAREQTAGVMQSAKAVQQLDSVTQQNAALVEQTAAAAGSLQDQAHGLAQEVSQFKLPAGA